MQLRHLYAAGTLAAGLGLLLAPTASRAQGVLDMTLTQPTLTIGTGGTVTFTGSVANNSGGTVFLNGDSFTLLGPGLTTNDAPFLLGAPLAMDDGTTYPLSGSAALFEVTAAPTLKDGLYSGYFNVLGGPTSADQTVEATEKFNVQVVPEPSSLAALSLLMLGVGVLAFRARRRGLSA